MRRAAGIAFGVGNHLLFAFIVWQLFLFLKGPESLPTSGGTLFGRFSIGIVVRSAP